MIYAGCFRQGCGSPAAKYSSQFLLRPQEEAQDCRLWHSEVLADWFKWEILTLASIWGESTILFYQQSIRLRAWSALPVLYSVLILWGFTVLMSSSQTVARAELGQLQYFLPLLNTYMLCTIWLSSDWTTLSERDCHSASHRFEVCDWIFLILPLLVY